MRQLTLLGFLSEYVKSLAECNSLNIHKLINEVYGGNYRLREPLFLYCFYSDKSDILLKYLNDTDKEEYTFIVTLLKNNQVDDLPTDFVKVLNSYKRKVGMKDNDDNIKRLNYICPAGRACSRWSPISLYRIDDLRENKLFIHFIKK